MNQSESDIQQAMGLALSMYAHEPCRICGKEIQLTDLKSAVFAGYSEDNTSRAAHKECWDGMCSVAVAYHDKYGHPVYAVDWEALNDNT